MLGLNLSNIINNKIKECCNLYSNTSYVPSIKTKFIYRENNKFLVDIHYDKKEYIKFNINIMRSINSNFNEKNFLIDFDKLLKKINYLEFNNIKNNCLENLYDLVLNNKDLINIDVLNYYRLRYPYDYFYTPKEYIEKMLIENAN